MVYETYETRAFVLAAHDVSESNRVFSLFTRDFGLVRAHAQSVRAEKSKLRFHLQVFSSVDVSLVRGKEYWRVVGAKESVHFFDLFRNDRAKISFLRHMFDLLIRMVHGEGAQAYVFTTLENAVAALSELESALSLKQLELLTVSRILRSLGYFSVRSEYDLLFADAAITPAILGSVAREERRLLTDINSALRESHL